MTNHEFVTYPNMLKLTSADNGSFDLAVQFDLIEEINMSVLRDKIIEGYIERNYPNSKIVTHDDPNSDLVFYTAQQLQSVDEDWFPLCCYKDPTDGKARYGGRKKVYHTYTEGETGAGKTTRFVMQSILALSSMKVKPSFVIVDIHGEIIENLYKHLKSNGYSIKILNCDEPQRSDTYNPFAELAEDCLKNGRISNDAINKIRKIAEIMQPVESTDDPIWDIGARSYTNGCILDKFEDLICGDLPVECMTLYNVIQNHYWLREKLADRYSGGDLFKIPHYKRKGSKSVSLQKMISVTNNAEKTRASYFGVVENHYDMFGQPSLYSLSSSNTIDISDFINEPTVIVIQSGNTRIGDDLISLLMNEIYTNVVKIGKESPTKKLPRKIHCFLDEFANCNIADGPEYIKMLTTSRKFGMFWHMILQCDAQLDRKFDANISRIIRANSTEIFMGSHDYETEVRFAKSCGQKTIESLGSTFNQQAPSLDVVDLMTPEQLNLTPEGYAYVKSNKYPLLKTFVEAFYNCGEFEAVEDIDQVYPYNSFDYQQTAFYPDELPPYLNQGEYELLNLIDAGLASYGQLMAKVEEGNLKRDLQQLVNLKLVMLLPERKLTLNLTQRQLDILKNRARCRCMSSFPMAAKESGKVSSAFSRATKENSDGIMDVERWIGTDPLKCDANAMELRTHIREKVGTTVMMQCISTCTIVPDSLRKLITFICCPGVVSEEELELPLNVNIMRFEIIEQFIRSHSFENKAQWEMQLREEVAYLTKNNLLTDVFMAPFRATIQEFCDEMTEENIREIKKILDIDEDDNDE